MVTIIISLSSFSLLHISLNYEVKFFSKDVSSMGREGTFVIGHLLDCISETYLKRLHVIVEDFYVF